MTKDEQTIANLKKLKSIHNGSYGADIDIAIKVLEQQPCEDSVSRQALLDSIAEIDGNTNMDIYTDEVREIINAIPSVTPTRKKGKWVDIWKDGNRIYGCRCSECGKDPIDYTYGYEEWWFEELPKFCSNCGSFMMEEG